LFSLLSLYFFCERAANFFSWFSRIGPCAVQPWGGLSAARGKSLWFGEGCAARGRFSGGLLCVTSNWPDPNAQRQIEVNLESEGNHYC